MSNYDTDHYIGDPTSQLDDWIYQGPTDTCAVAAETSLINQFITDDLSLDHASYISASQGWWQPGMGTDPSEIGNMMDLYGIPNHTVTNASLEQLATELQNGHGVIVGVNSGELWDTGLLAELKEFLCDAFGLDASEFIGADHAVTVTGIDTSDPANPMVILNDSGHPDGAGVMYPLEKFMDAWENSDFYYTATDIPIPDQLPPSSLGFDVGDFLGIGTTLLTGDPFIGQTVNAIADQIDWDEILTNL
jgi:hypothetical protein